MEVSASAVCLFFMVMSLFISYRMALYRICLLQENIVEHAAERLNSTCMYGSSRMHLSFETLLSATECFE